VSRVAVIVHERLGSWVGQLRPRLQDRPVRFFETRSDDDVETAVSGLASPVVVMDLGKDPVEGLELLDRIIRLSPTARVLILDPAPSEGVAELARELGATHVISGFVPPPEVAALIDRWIGLAAAQAQREGWSRPVSTGSPLDAEGLLEIALRD
jgi:hypothetical protein